ncbi:MAG: hypothetical protein HWD86_07085 [Kangiellaceae bacterium]|nr:hypothetical protein [Kangiellaceae bacterium]
MKKLLIVLSFIALPCFAEPSALIIDGSAKPKDSDSKIRAAHEEMLNPGNKAYARLAILTAMKQTRGMAWFLEEEEDGRIRARFDYRGQMIMVDVEYNDSLIQIKYVDGYDDYACENVIDRICYENHRHYYSYVKRLRHHIQNNL